VGPQAGSLNTSFQTIVLSTREGARVNRDVWSIYEEIRVPSPVATWNFPGFFYSSRLTLPNARMVQPEYVCSPEYQLSARTLTYDAQNQRYLSLAAA